jgi:hypothetical protein
LPADVLRPGDTAAALSEQLKVILEDDQKLFGLPVAN